MENLEKFQSMNSRKIQLSYILDDFLYSFLKFYLIIKDSTRIYYKVNPTMLISFVYHDLFT
jgi:hypothetical protein